VHLLRLVHSTWTELTWTNLLSYTAEWLVSGNAYWRHYYTSYWLAAAKLVYCLCWTRIPMRLFTLEFANWRSVQFVLRIRPYCLRGPYATLHSSYTIIDVDEESEANFNLVALSVPNKAVYWSLVHGLAWRLLFALIISECRRATLLRRESSRLLPDWVKCSAPPAGAVVDCVRVSRVEIFESRLMMFHCSL